MSSTEAPIVVIGSGPGGAAAALALTQRGFPVTLLESGTEDIRAFRVQAGGVSVFRRAQACRSPLPYTTAGDAGAVWYHELAMGGLSNHWTGACPRFHPNDFTDGARVGQEYEWPISYEDLVPYYRWAERLLKLSGTPNDAPCLPGGLRTYEHDIPRDWSPLRTVVEARGQGLVPIPLAAGKRWAVSTSPTPFNSREIIARLEGRSAGFSVMRGSHAVRIVCNGSNRASAVEVFDRADQTTKRIACSGVVVAAGALATCRLLLQSTDGIGGRHGLGNTTGVLGAYVHDHTKDWTVIRTERALPRLGHPLYLTRRAYDRSEPMTGVAYTFSARTRRIDRALVHLPGSSRTFGFSSFGMWTPTRENRVRLNDSERDGFGQSQIEIDVRFPESAMRVLEDARSELLDTLDAAGFGPTLVWSTSDSPPGGAVHWAGTARMNRSSEHGVCDGTGRIHGVENVAVGDASVFPTPVEKNPTLTLMALSARSALALARRLAG